MKRLWRNCWVRCVWLVVLVALIACTTEDVTTNSNVDAEENSPEENYEEAEPVTISVDDNVTEEGQAIVENWLADNYPHITVEWLGDLGVGSVGDMEELIAANNVPDVTRTIPSWGSNILFETGIKYDLSDLVDQFNFDLSVVDQQSLEGIRFYGGGELLGLPQLRASAMPDDGGMIFNKDVFDLFGVAYPSTDEAMTWEESISLAARLTGEEGGQHYYGMQHFFESFFEQVSVRQNLLDHETHEPLLDSHPRWQRAFETMQLMYSVPGQLNPENPAEHFNTYDGWNGFGEGNVAMSPFFKTGQVRTWIEEAQLNLGLIPAPYFEGDAVFPLHVSWMYLIPSTTEHKEEAFHVIQAFFTDEYLAHYVNEHLGIPHRLPISNDNILSQVDIDPAFQDMDMSVLEYHDRGEPILRSPYESNVRSRFHSGEYLYDYIVNGTDAVTMIRELQEEVERLVEDIRFSE